MTYFCRLLLLLVLSLLGLNSQAAVSKVSGYETFENSIIHLTVDAACNVYKYRLGPNEKQSGYSVIRSTPPALFSCEAKKFDGSVFSYGQVVESSVPQCPANSTASGVSCVCKSGFVEENGQCVAPDKCKDVAATCAGKKGGRRNYASASGGLDAYCIPPPDDFYWDQPKYPGCNTGCTLLPSGVDVALKDDQGKTWWQGEGKFSGGTCGLVMGDDSTSPDPDNPADPSKPKEPPAKPVDERCAGQTGTVNGKERSVFLHPVRRVLTGQERPRTATAPALRAKPSRHAPTAFANPPRQRPTRTQTARSRAPRPVRTR